ncbi:hypothetical protein HPP92_007747 [Vanilla planifolia]|uniref:Nuclear cap-binding protein subunit 2 n=1 Tax=Vanilla planifolia TaxID=51239 RepID=A0A835V7Z9_VANPL|nr:hypothetical protein HPP92_007747 [Vanilla planifolia]
MASLFKDPNKLSAYRDRRFPGTQEEYEHALQTSITVYVGNLSFYTTEEQVYELFSRAGEIKKIIMGLDKNTKTPCGFCFVLYYSRDDAEDAVKYISGTILDDRPIRVDFDWGFEEGRQWGRGRSGGQKELEAQRQLVDYGGGSLDSFHPNMPSHCELSIPILGISITGLGTMLLDSPSLWPGSILDGRHGDRGHGGYRNNRDYNRKRYRDEDRSMEYDSKGSDHDSRVEKNPRFRESGDSDEDEDDVRKRRR